MTTNTSLKPRRLLAIAAVPVVVTGLFLLVVSLARLVRYDPAYFSESYAAQYSTPMSVNGAMERAFQTDDRTLLAELQGLRWPHAFPTGDIRFVGCEEQGDGYYSYLFRDAGNGNLYLYHTIYLQGRWVAAPSDADFYLRTGRWTRTFIPITVLYWAVEIGIVLALVIHRAATRIRDNLYDEPTFSRSRVTARVATNKAILTDKASAKT